MMQRRISNISAVLGLLLSTALHAEVTDGAKSIFSSGYGPQIAVSAEPSRPSSPAAETKRSPPRPVASRSNTEKYLGVSYWVELTGRDGQTLRVTPSRTFYSGDRIKLKLRSNQRGYLYLLNRGSTGRYSVLFPYAGKNNLVQAHTTYTVPQHEHIVFDENPGEEILRIVMSSEPLSLRSEASYAATQARPIPAAFQCGSKDLYLDGPVQLVQLGERCGAKDLLVEEDTASAQPAAYAVAPLAALDAKGEMISLDLTLRHR